MSGCVFFLYTRLQATYDIFARIGWTLSLAWLVVAVQRNWAGPVKNFMEQPFWAPLGRLTYCTYLVHYFVIYFYFSLPEYPEHYESVLITVRMEHASCFQQVTRSLPIIVLSFALSFVWSCLFEIPSIKLETILVESLLEKSRLRSKPGTVAPSREKEDNIFTNGNTIVIVACAGNCKG